MSKTTFNDLGIPFPLYAAPVEATSDYAGLKDCDLCKAPGQHCFHIGIGGYVRRKCSNCGNRQVIQGCDAFSAGCEKCGRQLLDQAGSSEEPAACYDCLRAGHASITKDTEFGMITYEHAESGITHGRPGLKTEMFETLPPSDEGWVSAKIPSEVLKELISTPGYTSWQGDIWLFCCKSPMVFVGEWSEREFNTHATDGNALEMVKSMLSPSDHQTMDDRFPNHMCFYVFRCKTCSKQRAHWDID